MNKKINYKGSDNNLIKAVDSANSILENDDFHRILSEKLQFDHSNATGAIISNLIKNTKVNAYVELYKSTLPWSKVNGYTLPGVKDKIFLNSRKFNNKLNFLGTAATLVHEFIHLVDFENDGYLFHHEGNDSARKDNTAPYWIDQIAEQILNKQL